MKSACESLRHQPRRHAGSGTPWTPRSKKAPERAVTFTTISGRPIERLYTAGRRRRTRLRPRRQRPRRSSRTRAGIHPTGYRGKLWTMRQFAGFGTPEETNERYKHLLRGRRHRPERGLRPADADGPRPRPRAVARRGGEVRRQHRVARRHGDALRGHLARRHHHVDDDQLAGVDALRDVPGRRRAAGRRLEEDLRARSRTTS